jgi:hypothetical protein
MSRVITFSRVFPSYHPRAGEPTYFVEKVLKSLYDPALILNPPQEFKTVGGHDITNLNLKQPIEPFDPKHHTIRAGHRFKVGDFFSPRVWSNSVNPKSGRSGPYHSKQITFAPDIEVKKTWDFDIDENGIVSLNGEYLLEYEDGRMNDVEQQIATNDGLSDIDFFHWLIYPVYKSAKPFDGQIICWNENINY